MRRSSSRTRVSRGTTRKFVWARHTFVGEQTGAAVGGDLLSQFETDYGAQLIGATITRIRGYAFAQATDATDNTINQYRMGIRVLSGNLDLSGTVPDQDPWTDENADWMAWMPFASVVAVGGLPIGDSVLNAMRVDVKAQRRLDELGERLVLFQAGNPGAPTITWAVGWDLSIGVKLP